MPKPRKRKTANVLEQKMGVRGQTNAFANDFFTNGAARMGFGTPSVAEGAGYELVRFSFAYWDLITLFRNHAISRKIVEVPAIDMVRAWPKITSDIDPKDLTRIDRALRRTNTKNNILTALTWGRLFGGAGGLMVIKGQENELDQPLDLESIGIGAFSGVIPFDRWSGIMPTGEVCTDVSRPLDFGKPESYEIRTKGGDSFQVHSSRILRFLGPTVPEPEVSAMSEWGISILEPAYETIRKIDNLSWSILSLSMRSNILAMKFPELAQLLSGLGSSQVAAQKFEQRMSNINHLLSSQSFVPLPADGSIENTSSSFAGLADIYQVFQLDLAAAAQMPVVRLFGRTYSGLGAAGDADEMIYAEKIAADQAAYLAPQLEKLYPVLCQSELGEVPEDLDLVFPSIRVMDEKEKSELSKTVVDTIIVALNGGLISARTAAKELKQSSDTTGIFTNITDEDIEKLPDTVQSEGELGEGLFGEEGGLDPAASPAKAIKEENKAGKSLEQEAGEAHSTAPAMDALPSGLVVGEKILVNGKLLAVSKITTETTDLFGEPTVQVQFTTGEIVAYAAPSKAKATDADGPSTKHDDMMLYHALPVRIETPAGKARSGVTEDGEAWRTNMPADYGFIDMGINGADGDSLDCYVGPSPESGNVYVVDQYDLAGKYFDEHKCLLGYHTKESALDDYMAGHHKSGQTFAAITEFTMPMFRKWMATHDMSKPCNPEVRQ